MDVIEQLLTCFDVTGVFLLCVGEAVRRVRTDVDTWVGVNGRALKQHRGSPVGQRPVDTVTVSRYPADVGHTAEHVPVMVAEDILPTRGHD